MSLALPATGKEVAGRWRSVWPVYTAGVKAGDVEGPPPASAGARFQKQIRVKEHETGSQTVFLWFRRVYVVSVRKEERIVR